MADSRSTTEVDVERFMEMIQRRVDAQPDAQLILIKIEEIRRYADGICEATTFNSDLNSRLKSLIYRLLFRVFKTNFERQRLFNHALVDALQLMTEDMYKFQRLLATNRRPDPD